MQRLTTDTPKGNLQALLNFAYAKDGNVWLRGVADGKDVELCEYISRQAWAEKDCDLTPEEIREGSCLEDCFCELGALYAAATQAAELRARLAQYEATGLEPEEIQDAVNLFNGYTDDLPKEIKKWAERGAWHVRKCDELSKKLRRFEQAEAEGRLVVLPCKGDDVTIERGGLIYKGDHWNPPELTAFAEDPTTRTGKRVALFNAREVMAALREERDHE